MAKAAQRYILLPPRGLNTDSVGGNLHVNAFMASLHPRAAHPHMKVIDSAHENGIKLVEMTPEGIAALRAQAPGVRIVPEVFYQLARSRMPRIESMLKTRSGAKPGLATLQVLAEGTNAPVAGATVVAFTDFKNGIGAQGKTRKNGSVSLALGSVKKLERIYVYPVDGYWPMLKKNVALPLAKPLALHPIDLAAPDVLQY